MGRALLCAGAISLFGAVGAAALSFSGLCFSKRQYLSDQDYFAAAIEPAIGETSHTLVLTRAGAIEFRPVRAIPYASIDEFYKVNPDCCKTTPHNSGDAGPYTSWLDRLAGHAARVIAVTYVLRYVDGTGEQQQTTVTTQHAVTNCGRAWSARH